MDQLTELGTAGPETYLKPRGYMPFPGDSLIELWFHVPLDTKQVISETFPQANLLAWRGKN